MLSRLENNSKFQLFTKIQISKKKQKCSDVTTFGYTYLVGMNRWPVAAKIFSELLKLPQSSMQDDGGPSVAPRHVVEF